MKIFIRSLAVIAVLLASFACSRQTDTIDYAVGVKDMPDLAGKKVSVISGSLHDLEIASYQPSPQLMCFNSVAEVVAAVYSGQADYAIIDTIAIIGMDLEKYGLKMLFASDVVSGPYGFGFRYSDKELQQEFNGFLAKYQDEGKLKNLVDRWTKGDVVSVRMPEIPLNPDGETLVVGTMNFFPFTFIQDGEFSGLEIEILKTFAFETGRNIQFEFIDFSGLIAALGAEKIDVISSSMTITEERCKQVLFSDPYYFCNTVCLIRNPDATKNIGLITKIKESFYNNLILEDRWKIILDGLYETIFISLLAILLGSLFGAFLCWMRMSRNGLLRKIASIYIEIVRGVPILVFLMLMFYVVFAKGTMSARWVAIIAFALNFGAYVSEMFRTGIESIDRGQVEAGLAMGFSPLRTFFNFVVPPAAVRVLPVFKGAAVSLFKDTSVVGFIAVQDLTKASEIIRARTFDAFFPLIIISIIYFVLAWLFGKLLVKLGDKLA